MKTTKELTLVEQEVKERIEETLKESIRDDLFKLCSRQSTFQKTLEDIYFDKWNIRYGYDLNRANKTLAIYEDNLKRAERFAHTRKAYNEDGTPKIDENGEHQLIDETSKLYDQYDEYTLPIETTAQIKDHINRQEVVVRKEEIKQEIETNKISKTLTKLIDYTITIDEATDELYDYIYVLDDICYDFIVV